MYPLALISNFAFNSPQLLSTSPYTAAPILIWIISFVFHYNFPLQLIYIYIYNTAYLISYTFIHTYNYNRFLIRIAVWHATCLATALLDCALTATGAVLLYFMQAKSNCLDGCVCVCVRVNIGLHATWAQMHIHTYKWNDTWYNSVFCFVAKLSFVYSGSFMLLLLLLLSK